MLKPLFAAMLFAGLSLGAQCLELTLNDGKVYRDVQVANQTPDGIDIVSHQDIDMIVTRHIRYDELSPASLKDFPGYDKSKADDYLVSMRSLHEKALAAHKQDYTAWIEQLGGGHKVVYPVPSANKMRVVFTATKTLEHGTIGWASADGLSDDMATHFGKIYLHGLKISQDGQWVGTVYLTNKMMIDKNETCPCYATSLENARKIDKREKRAEEQ